MEMSNPKGVRSIFVGTALLMVMLLFTHGVYAAADIKSGHLNIKGSAADGRLMLDNQLLMRSWAYFSLNGNGKKYSASVLSSTANKPVKGRTEEIICTKYFPEIGYKHTVSVKKIENGFKIVIGSFFSKECVAPYIYIYPLLSWQILNGAKYEVVDENNNISRGVISPSDSKRKKKMPLKTNLKKVTFQLKAGGKLTLALKRKVKSKFLQYIEITPRGNGKSELRLKLFQGNKEKLFPEGYNEKTEMLIKYEK